MGKVLQIQENSKKIKSKKKNKKPSHTRVHFILDESGSMGSCWQPTIDGFNEYITTLKNDKDGNTYDVSLTKFEGGNVVRLFENVNVNKVKKLDQEMYCPRGGTNLNDAIGFTITEMMNHNSKKKQNTLVIIMTDGYENMSREWTQEGISNLIKGQEKAGWTVTFLGANIDTAKVGKAYSIKGGNMKSYSTNNMANTMRGLATATTAYASSNVIGGASSDFFSETGDWTKFDESVKTFVDANLSSNSFLKKSSIIKKKGRKSDV